MVASLGSVLSPNGIINMSLKIASGDLLKADVEAVINTVNCVGVMGKGIALQFKKKWPAAYKEYKKVCDAKELRPGMMHVFERGKIAEKPHYIINFPTKDHWRGKSKIEFIDEGLVSLIESIKQHNIKSIAIPPLGCGNGGLEWEMIAERLEHYLKELSEEVDIYIYPPEGAPEAKSLVVNTQRPNMTAGRAVLVKLIELYSRSNYSLSKIEVQKLCYFAQELGQPLRLNYTKNQFGPYADNLKHVLNAVDGHFITGVGDHDTSNMGLVLTDGVVVEADDFLKGDSSTLNILPRIERLIDGFETPFGMELLATVHWIITKEVKCYDLDKVYAAIEKWSSTESWNVRKASLMKKPIVEKTIKHLQHQAVL